MVLGFSQGSSEQGTVKKLLNGIVDFRKNVRPTVKDTFALLALGQRPDTLFIACSDSRVVPNLFASTEPGDLFVIRNVGNLIPPYDADSTALGSEAAAIQFGLANLPITEVIVCGHSECGAIGALSNQQRSPDAPAFDCWLRHGAGSLRELEAGASLGNHLERHNQLSQLNVLEQLEHLKTYPVVQERVASASSACTAGISISRKPTSTSTSPARGASPHRRGLRHHPPEP